MSEPAAEARSERRIVRDLAALGSAEVLAKLAGFAAFAWLARALSPERYGGVELAIQISLALGMLIDFGLGPIGARAVAAAPQDAHRTVAEVTTLRLWLAVPAIACAWAIASALDVPSDVRSLVRVVALSLLAAPFVSSWLFQGLGRMPWVAGAQLLRMCIFAGIVIGLVRSDAQLELVGFAEVSATFALAAWYWVGQRRSIGRTRLGAPASRLRALATSALPVALSRGVVSIQQFAPTLLVAQFSGASELAWFAAAHRLVTSLGAFVEIHLFNLFPQLVRALEAGDGRLARALEPSFRASAWIGGGVGLATSLFARPALGLVFGDRFTTAAPVLTLAIWSLPLGLLAGHARFSLLAAGAQRAELAANVAGAVATLAIAAAFVPRVGPLGAAAALTAGAAVTWCAAHWLASARAGPMPLAPGLRALTAGALLSVLAPALGSDWVAGALAISTFGGLAFLCEPALRSDLIRLAFRRGE